MSRQTDKPFNLRLEGVTFAYRDRAILQNLHFEIAEKQSIGLLGANGSGKTTLFRCITGLEKISAGAILLNGQSVRTEKDFQLLRRSIGYSLQDAEDQLIFPTVIEDASFGPLNLGLDHAASYSRAEATLDLLGIGGLAQRLTHELSGGQQKLVALAAVLAMRPALLLLDEPFNALDQQATERLIEVIASLDCAKIIVAHSAHLLKRICPTFLILKNGSLSLLEAQAQTC